MSGNPTPGNKVLLQAMVPNWKTKVLLDINHDSAVRNFVGYS